jgi:translocator protein
MTKTEVINDLEDKKWYKKLNKSKLTPPGYVFGIVWTILYILLTIYFVLGLTQKGSERALIYFGAQMILNFSWTYVFFTEQKLLLSFFMILAIIALTIKSMMEMHVINPKIVYLLVPYVAWLCLAGYLNLYIIIKN